MKKAVFFLLTIMLILSCNNAENSTKIRQNSGLSLDQNVNQKLSVAEKIANKNGYNNWKDVSEISFTFNVYRGDNHFERSWVWNPKTDDVLMMSSKDTVHYNRANIDSSNQKNDASFINDKYWLLAPFNLVWDVGTTFSVKHNVIAPISKDTLNQLTIVYSNVGGYTPGDAYDFFYGKDFLIKEWTYRKNNDSIPSLNTTWEDYENFNGITISKTRKDSTGLFNIIFTNISVKR